MWEQKRVVCQEGRQVVALGHNSIRPRASMALVEMAEQDFGAEALDRLRKTRKMLLFFESFFGFLPRRHDGGFEYRFEYHTQH
jgi:hypothetical protein